MSGVGKAQLSVPEPKRWFIDLVGRSHTARARQRAKCHNSLGAFAEFFASSWIHSESGAFGPAVSNKANHSSPKQKTRFLAHSRLRTPTKKLSIPKNRNSWLLLLEGLVGISRLTGAEQCLAQPILEAIIKQVKPVHALIHWLCMSYCLLLDDDNGSQLKNKSVASFFSITH